MLKHVWFDFSDTIGKIDREVYNEILYGAYAKATGKELNAALEEEYKREFEKHKSNSAVFVSLGLPASFLPDALSVVEPRELYELTDDNIPHVLQKLIKIVPVSIFSNNKMDDILPALGVQLEWFTHIIGPHHVQRPKPALEGFHKMIELSAVEPGEVLYVGDSVNKDIKPANEVGITTGILWEASDVAAYSFKNFKEILELFEAQ